MKKFFTLFAMLAFLLPMVRAQETLTVNDGTASSSNIPFYGLYVDTEGQCSEFIIPAESLAEMNGGTITKLTFYLQTSATYAWASVHNVYMKEVDGTTLSTLSGGADATVVYSGSVDATGTTLEINFTQDFQYGGGNLLIGQIVTTEDEDYGSAYFYGVGDLTSGVSAYRTTGSDYTQTFLPKVTFEYTPGGGNICRRPSGLVLDTLATTATTLTFNWTAPEGVSEFLYSTDGTTWTATGETTVTLDDLTPGTKYTIKVCSLCSEGEDTSAAASASAWTSCVPVTSLFADFSQWTAGRISDPCWLATSTYSSYIPIRNYDDANRLYLVGYNSGYSQYYSVAVLPEIDENVALNSLELVVNAKGYEDNSSYYYDYVSNLSVVALDTFGYAPAHATVLATLPISADDYNTYVISLADYEGEGHYLALLADIPASSSTYNNIYISSVDLHAAPSCRYPQGVAASEKTSTGVTLIVADSTDVNKYHVIIYKDTTTVYNEVVYSKEIVIEEGLTSNTIYQVSVAAVCDDDNETAKVFTRFRTECDPIMTLPFAAGFDRASDLDEEYFPLCWYRLSGSEYLYRSYNYYDYDTTIYHFPEVFSGNGANGTSNGLGFNGRSGDTNLVCTSIIPLESDAINIRFWGKVTGSTVKLEAGLISDMEDPSTFVPLVELTSADNSSYSEFDFYTDEFEDAAGIDEPRLAFRATGFSSISASGVAYVDQIQISALPACRRPSAAEVVNGSVTYEGATISWSATECDSYEVRYGTASTDTSATSTTAQSVFEDSETSTPISGLRPNTTYYVWVRSVCGNDHSDWRPAGRFTTDRSCYAVSGLTVDNTSYHAAHVSWRYAGNGRGLEESGVRLTLRDTAVVRTWTMTAEEGTGLFLTDLELGTNYSLEVRTLCDPDSAEAQTVTFATAQCGQIDGTSTTNYIPFQGNYNYGYSQTLYAKSDVGMPTISGLSWKVTSTPNSYPQRPIEVWVGTTNMTSLSTSSYVDTADMIKVFDGTLNVGQVGWTSAMFDQPWTIPANGDNIVVAVLNKTGNYSSMSFAAYSGTTGQGVYGYQDPSVSDPYTISSYANNNYTNTIPAIRFEGDCELSCLPPMLALGDVESNSVGLAWVAGADETEWVVSYKADSSASWTVNSQKVSTTTTTVNDLDATTHYIFRVGMVCNGEDTVWSNTVSCWTACGVATELPIVETFENTPANEDPLCWTVVNYGSSGSHYVTGTQRSGSTGHQSMYFYPYGVHYLISQALPEGVDATALEVNFWSSINSYGNSRLEAGLMTDPNDTNTFVSLFNRGAGDWAEGTFYTENADVDAGAPVYVAFRVYCTSGYSNYIDDITIGESSCRRVTDLHVTALNHESATLAWTGMEEGSYELYWSDTNVAPTAESTLEPVGEASYDLSDLEPQKNYYVWVRTVCGENATAWSSMTFRTPCVAEGTPWSETFNSWADRNANDCWTFAGGAWSTTPELSGSGSWNLRSDNTNGGITIDGKALYMDVYSTNKGWAITPAIQVNSNVVLSFDIAAADYYNNSDEPTFDENDYFVAAISTDGGGSWTPLYRLGAGATDDGTLTALTDEYTHISLPLDESYVEQTIRLAFFAGSEESGGDNDLVLDNIELLSSECMHPVDVAVAAGVTEAVISWSDMSTENTSGYELVINTGDSLTGDNVRTLSIDAEVYTATVEDLTPRTTYYYFLRSACEEEPTMGSWARGSFRTGCLPIELPYDEDFDIYEEGDTPDCWDIISAHSNSNGEFPTVIMDGANGVFYFYGYTSGASGKMVAATPYIPAALNNLEISFDVYSSTSLPLIVYLATDPNDETTYQQIGSYSDITGEETIEISIDTVSGLTFTDADSGYVVFSGTTGYYDYYYNENYTNAYIDNLHIAMMNPCRRVSGVTVSGVTESSATLTWNEVEGAEGYRVLYGTENDVTAATPLNDVTDTTATLSDLSETTKYYVWVYTLCAEQSMSDSRSASFTTTLIPAALPYSTGFEEGDDVAWVMTTAANSWFIGSAASNGGTNGIYISNDNGTTNAYNNNSASVSYASKLFNFDEGEYTLNYDWRCNGEGSDPRYDYLRVFVVPATTALVANDGSNYNTSSNKPDGSIYASEPMNLSTEWQSVTATVTVEAAGYYNVVFYWRNDGSVGSNPPAAIDNVSIALNGDVPPVGIDEVEAADIVLYPNPATSNVTLRGVEAGSQVSVVDMNGRMVRDFQATSNDVRIDVSTLAKGAYFVRVVNDKVNSIQKLIVR